MEDWQENPNIVLDAPNEPWNCEPETYSPGPGHFFRFLPSVGLNYTLSFDGTLKSESENLTGIYTEGKFCVGPQDVAGTIQWVYAACDQGVREDGNYF